MAELIESNSSWSKFDGGEVFCCDCREYLKDTDAHPDGGFRLIFADPPFGIGVEYDGFDDHMSPSEYRGFTLSWMSLCKRAMSDDGRLCVHVPDSCVHAVLDAALHSGLERQEWIIWHYRFGQNTATRYVNAKCHLLVFTNPDWELDPYWNPCAVAVESDRAKMGDPRTNKRSNKSKMPAGKRVPGDVWGVPSDGKNWGRIQGNNAERRSLHENQLPEVYLGRIISGYTEPEDWVLDIFGGSGTTPVVADALGRRFVAVEQSEAYFKSLCERVESGAVRYEAGDRAEDR